jgi:hypothetical protein
VAEQGEADALLRASVRPYLPGVCCHLLQRVPTSLTQPCG